MLKYFEGCHSPGICLMLFSCLDAGYGFGEGGEDHTCNALILKNGGKKEKRAIFIRSFYSTQYQHAMSLLMLLWSPGRGSVCQVSPDLSWKFSPLPQKLGQKSPLPRSLPRFYTHTLGSSQDLAELQVLEVSMNLPPCVDYRLCEGSDLVSSSI